MTISPSSSNPEDNMKNREVYCRTCKTFQYSRYAHPTCQECGNYMITVIYSLIDGKRLTGNDELASGNNKTT
jgi:hypothetical protein